MSSNKIPLPIHRLDDPTQPVQDTDLAIISQITPTGYKSAKVPISELRGKSTYETWIEQKTQIDNWLNDVKVSQVLNQQQIQQFMEHTTLSLTEQNYINDIKLRKFFSDYMSIDSNFYNTITSFLSQYEFADETINQFITDGGDHIEYLESTSLEQFYQIAYNEDNTITRQSFVENHLNGIENYYEQWLETHQSQTLEQFFNDQSLSEWIYESINEISYNTTLANTFLNHQAIFKGYVDYLQHFNQVNMTTQEYETLLHQILDENLSQSINTIVNNQISQYITDGHTTQEFINNVTLEEIYQNILTSTGQTTIDLTRSEFLNQEFPLVNEYYNQISQTSNVTLQEFLEQTTFEDVIAYYSTQNTTILNNINPLTQYFTMQNSTILIQDSDTPTLEEIKKYLNSYNLSQLVSNYIQTHNDAYFEALSMDELVENYFSEYVASYSEFHEEYIDLLEDIRLEYIDDNSSDIYEQYFDQTTLEELYRIAHNANQNLTHQQFFDANSDIYDDYYQNWLENNYNGTVEQFISSTTLLDVYSDYHQNNPAVTQQTYLNSVSLITNHNQLIYDYSNSEFFNNVTLEETYQQHLTNNSSLTRQEFIQAYSAILQNLYEEYEGSVVNFFNDTTMQTVYESYVEDNTDVSSFVTLNDLESKFSTWSQQLTNSLTPDSFIDEIKQEVAAVPREDFILTLNAINHLNAITAIGYVTMPFDYRIDPEDYHPANSNDEASFRFEMRFESIVIASLEVDMSKQELMVTEIHSDYSYVPEPDESIDPPPPPPPPVISIPGGIEVGFFLMVPHAEDVESYLNMTLSCYKAPSIYNMNKATVAGLNGDWVLVDSILGDYEVTSYWDFSDGQGLRQSTGRMTGNLGVFADLHPTWQWHYISDNFEGQVNTKAIHYTGNNCDVIEIENIGRRTRILTFKPSIPETGLGRPSSISQVVDYPNSQNVTVGPNGVVKITLAGKKRS